MELTAAAASNERIDVAIIHPKALLVFIQFIVIINERSHGILQPSKSIRYNEESEGLQHLFDGLPGYFDITSVDECFHCIQRLRTEGHDLNLIAVQFWNAIY